MNDWFRVDKNGLEALLARRGKEFVLFELIQNAWDEDVTRVSVTLEPVPGKPLAVLSVEDDSPDGFQDLAHAYTLFAESKKKAEPGKRGRFNFGEKLVLACCESAVIETTTGTIKFHADGSRVKLRSHRARGSQVQCLLRMTREEMSGVIAAASRLIPPGGVTTVNGVEIPRRDPVTFFEATLSTEVADAEGMLRAAKRRCEVYIHEPLPGEVGSVYEMGIPVVETGDRFHYNVMQKVPLTLDRDNVPPAYLQALRVHALNATVDLVEKDEATEPWVRAAAGDSRCEAPAVERVMDLRFGEKRVAYDVSDPEANKIATAAGYAIVHGGSLSAGEWEQARSARAIFPAGQVTPSRPDTFAPSAPLPPRTDGMDRVERLCVELGERLMGVAVRVAFGSSPTASTLASYGDRTITFNVGRLGVPFFEYPANREEIVDLIIHEFGHEYSGDHLSRDYYHALTRLAAKAVELALTEPQVFAAERRGIE